MTITKPYASVIILVKNGLPYIKECLDAVFCQDVPWPFEVVVIDSGSQDGSLDVIKRTPARLINIPPEEFNHGRTRNLGADIALGEYLIYLVADATPVGKDWMLNLVRAAEIEGVAGAYSRHLPRPEHSLLTRTWVLRWHNQTERLIKSYPQNYQSLSPEDRFRIALYDDVSSCMKKKVWVDFPYGEFTCEDVEWSDRVLAAGYKIVFEPTSIVLHSHQRSLKSDLKRIYVHSKQLYKFFGLSPIKNFAQLLRTCLWVIKDGFLLACQSNLSLKDKLSIILQTPGYSARAIAEYLGPRSEDLRRRFRWYSGLDQWLTRGMK